MDKESLKPQGESRRQMESQFKIYSVIITILLAAIAALQGYSLYSNAQLTESVKQANADITELKIKITEVNANKFTLSDANKLWQTIFDIQKQIAIIQDRVNTNSEKLKNH